MASRKGRKVRKENCIQNLCALSRPLREAIAATVQVNRIMHFIPLRAEQDNLKVELQRKRRARSVGVHALACPAWIIQRGRLKPELQLLHPDAHRWSPALRLSGVDYQTRQAKA